MSEKLSERLINAADDGDNLGVNEHTVDTALLREAARIVRAVEDAPEAMFASHDVGSAPVGCEWDDRIASINGKRVKLVEAV